MAGHRRRHGKPTLRVSKAARRQAALEADLEAAANPRERVAAAADYVRGALACHTAPPKLVDRLVNELKQAGDRIYREGGGTR